MKATTEYCADKKSKDGFQSQCKVCKYKWISKYQKSEVGKRKRRDWERKTKRGLKKYYKNRISMNFSRRMRKALNSDKGGRSWESLVDYSLEELKQHLEKQFVEGMNWNNYGSHWHIDHIRPVVSFDIKSTDCEDFKKCWSLKNIQPLFKYDNLSKGSKYKGPFV